MTFRMQTTEIPTSSLSRVRAISQNQKLSEGFTWLSIQTHQKMSKSAKFHVPSWFRKYSGETEVSASAPCLLRRSRVNFKSVETVDLCNRGLCYRGLCLCYLSVYVCVTEVYG